MSQVGGLKTIETVLTDIKEKVTTAEVPMFRHCCGLNAMKENQAQKETPIIYFKKNDLLITKLHYVNYCSCL
jgi:hypothetical protein